MPSQKQKQPYNVVRAPWFDNSKKYDPNVNGVREMARRARQIVAGQLSVYKGGFMWQHDKTKPGWRTFLMYDPANVDVERKARRAASK